MGSILAFIAFVSWGFGDFLIQKSTRTFGNWMSVFYVALAGFIGLLPFVWEEIPDLFSHGLSSDLLILGLTACFEVCGSLIFFESLRRGKIAVVEPIFAFEIPVTILLAWLFLHETLSGWQLGLIAVIVVGIILISLKSLKHLKKIRLETGVILAIVATVIMGGTDFLYGLGSRATSPLLINWFASAIVLIVTSAYLWRKGRLKDAIPDIKARPGIVVWLVIMDNLGWIAYSYSMLYVPIAIATGISEAYIALAVLLGLTLNREKLKAHQAVGLAVILVAVFLLARTVGFE